MLLISDKPTRGELVRLLRHGDQLGRDVISDIAMLKEIEEESWGPRLRQLVMAGKPIMAGNIHYWDSPEPLMTAAQAAVTLATTDKLLIPAAFTTAWSNLFGGKAGKVVDLLYYGSITTAATPGNIGIELYWGAADAGGTLLASSAAIALVASQTTIPFRIEAVLKNRGPFGSACSVLPRAGCKFGTAVIASPNDDFIVPAGAPTAVNIDVTAASGFNVQAKRSGSTVETMTVQDCIPFVS
jgi:hypothetical protein